MLLLGPLFHLAWTRGARHRQTACRTSLQRAIALPEGLKGVKATAVVFFE